MTRVYATQDESCHWYVIPYDRKEEFFKDEQNEDMIDSGEFDDKWGQYRTGGGLNLIPLYAEI
jgi:hypothetical protein